MSGVGMGLWDEGLREVVLWVLVWMCVDGWVEGLGWEGEGFEMA